MNHPLAPDRQTFLQVTRGQAVVSGYIIAAGDGVMINNEQGIDFSSDGSAEVLVFDLP